MDKLANFWFTRRTDSSKAVEELAIDGLHGEHSVHMATVASIWRPFGVNITPSVHDILGVHIFNSAHRYLLWRPNLKCMLDPVKNEKTTPVKTLQL